jgi:alkaline phosphatase D
MPRLRFASRAFSRRRFLGSTALIGAGGALSAGFPMPAIARGGRPVITHGVQTGDVTPGRGMVWARADRPARMIVEWATTEGFADARRVVGPAALAETDYTAKLDLAGLPAGQQVFYRVLFEDLASPTVTSEPVAGRFRTAPGGNGDITFVWSGDTAGQGWGIDEAWGGMRCYETMRRLAPDFFIHSGDTVYCDNPLQAEVELEDGTVWRNLMTEEKAKVAETMQEFRGNFQYNLLDANVRAFNAEVPMMAQWDDHEVVNNWYPGEMLEGDDRYTVKSASLLAARANRAFHEYMPIRPTPGDPERIHRVVPYGPHLDVFFLDMRSFRGPNGANDQAAPGGDAAFLGAEQVRWLKQALLASTATWKVIASDMPIGMVVYDDWRTKSTFENGANGDGPVRGREHEFADLLRFIRDSDIRNTVWLTADVHYTQANFYDPNRARFQDFAPFWEFVSGPIHAGSFGPNDMDDTFGPQVMYMNAPDGVNLPPSAGLQFFGHVAIDGATGAMTVTLKDLENTDLYAVRFDPTTGEGTPV